MSISLAKTIKYPYISFYGKDADRLVDVIKSFVRIVDGDEGGYWSQTHGEIIENYKNQTKQFARDLKDSL